MAFNLPPPWDPGYALPPNVRDEGLERHAYITKQMPRGTYDQPNVSTGGYVVPQYVMDEGYGQGTYTTKWVPRGTYWPKVPHWLNARPRVVSERRIAGGGKLATIARAQLSGLGGGGYIATSPQGAHASVAGQILDRVRSLPKELRAKVLRQTLDTIHPTLKKRAAGHAAQLQKRGLSAASALHQGLATALSERPSRPASQFSPLQGLGSTLAERIKLLGNQFAGQPIGGITSGSKSMSLGPFMAAYTANTPVTYAVSDLTGEQVNALKSYLVKIAALLATRCVGSTMGGGNPLDCAPTFDLASVGIPGPGNTKVMPSVVNGSYPAAYFDHPETGRRQGVFFKFTGQGTASPRLQIWWQENRTLVELLIDGLTGLVAAIIDLAKDIVCAVAGSSSAGNLVVGAATGAGAGVVGQVCGSPPAPQYLPQPSSILPLAIAGGAVVVVALLLGKRKSATP